MVKIVLVEPETSGNIGAIARAMKNFNLKELILINPKCNHLDKESLDRASHAKDILKKAKILKNIKQIKASELVATTAIIGRDYNTTRTPIELKDFKPNKQTAILLGRESHGLSNEEIEQCDYLINIPSSKSYPTLNLSHAATIIFYEIFNKESTITLATKNQKEQLLKLINKKTDNLNLKTPEKYKILWKRIIGKSQPTSREISTLFGFFKKIK